MGSTFWNSTDILGDGDIVAKTKGGRLKLTLDNSDTSSMAASTVVATKRE